jgi:exodeoxyribonuclease VII small subunit
MAGKKFNYQEALKQIEDTVSKIENEQVDVDELSLLVKKAAGLIKQCKAHLRNTGEELDGIIGQLDE